MRQTYANEQRDNRPLYERLVPEMDDLLRLLNEVERDREVLTRLIKIRQLIEVMREADRIGARREAAKAASGESK